MHMGAFLEIVYHAVKKKTRSSSKLTHIALFILPVEHPESFMVLFMRQTFAAK
jgi:hypothetical protein